MAKKKTIRTIPQERAPVREQDPRERAKNFKEVVHRFRLEDALHEAERCLLCPDPACVEGCPVSIDIPGFIQKISAKDLRGAYDVITGTNLLPAICGNFDHATASVCSYRHAFKSRLCLRKLFLHLLHHTLQVWLH